MRRAKIVCTLGPAVSSEAQIRALVDAGMDVARLNLSHGDHADHEQVYLRVYQVCSKCHDIDNDPHFDLAVYWPKVVHTGLKKK